MYAARALTFPGNKTIPAKTRKYSNNDKKVVTGKPGQQIQPTNPVPEVKDTTIAVSTLEQAGKLADRGQFDEALKMILATSQEDCTTECFTLLGIIYGASNNSNQAEKSLRKALFLDPNHHEAIIHLALLLEKKGDLKNAELLRKRMNKSQSHNKSDGAYG